MTDLDKLGKWEDGQCGWVWVRRGVAVQEEARRLPGRSRRALQATVRSLDFKCDGDTLKDLSRITSCWLLYF